MKLSHQLLAALLLAATALSISAQTPSVMVVQTQTSVTPAKARYARGELVTISVKASLIRLNPAPNGGYRQTPAGVAANALVFVSEKSTRGAYRIATGKTDRAGMFSMTYRIPTDPLKDRLGVCAWSLNEEPFEGQEVKLPIGR